MPSSGRRMSSINCALPCARKASRVGSHLMTRWRHQSGNGVARTCSRPTTFPPRTHTSRHITCGAQGSHRAREHASLWTFHRQAQTAFLQQTLVQTTPASAYAKSRHRARRSRLRHHSFRRPLLPQRRLPPIRPQRRHCSCPQTPCSASPGGHAVAVTPHVSLHCQPHCPGRSTQPRPLTMRAQLQRLSADWKATLLVCVWALVMSLRLLICVTRLRDVGVHPMGVGSD